MKTILAIDDDPDVGALIKMILEPNGYKVVFAQSGRLGIQYIQEVKPDLIICDMMMPEMSGEEIISILRNDPIQAATPFIFLTVKGRREEHRKGMELGADDYLSKPFLPHELRGAVNSVLKKHETRVGIPKLVSGHVFLSYSRRDSAFMKNISVSLVSANLSVWTDEILELGTPDWEKTISNAIKQAGCLVAILSPDAEQSIWVARELAMAETANIKIFPMLIRGDEKTSIPIRLISHQWIDARENHDEAVHKLVTVIRGYLIS